MDNYKIVVADSDRKSREMICALLTSRGYQVYQAKDSGETLRLSRSLFPDLVIMDVGITGINAFSTAGIIEEDRVSNVVFITSKIDSVFYDQLRKMNIFAYITKPVNPEQLYQTLEFSINNIIKLNNLQLRIEDLETELKNRKLIERAKGILIKKLGISEDESYRHLRKKSMDLCIPIYKLAEKIIDNYG